ncbi:MAG: hypothetical protein JRG85_17110 [Deltaproteobacteria bacterium]|nr:hypothetical protein [Deltaproteobacteria bacterium]
MQLATYFLSRGDDEHARHVFEDMEHERPERLASIREELLGEDNPDYWEVTDRGVNFGYLPPDRRARVPEFFAWFGNRIPPRREIHDPDAGVALPRRSVGSKAAGGSGS